MRKIAIAITIVITLLFLIFQQGFADDYFFIRAYTISGEKDHIKVTIYYGEEEPAGEPSLTYDIYEHDVLIKAFWQREIKHFACVKADSEKEPIILMISDKEENIYIGFGGEQEVFAVVSGKGTMKYGWGELLKENE